MTYPVGSFTGLFRVRIRVHRWGWTLLMAALVGDPCRADALRDQVLELVAQHHFLHPDPRQQPPAAGWDALAAYVRGLDPYSRLLTADQARRRERVDRSLLLGLGLDILDSRRELLVVPYGGGPAAAAGLEAPALLLAVDGRAAVSLEQVAEWFPELELGTEVALMATRRLSVLPRSYRMRAKLFRRPTVERVREDGFTLIRVHRFAAGETAEAIRPLIRDLSERGLPLVFDLRYCPGGSLLEALDVASSLLPGGTPMVTLEDADGVRERIVAEPGTVAPEASAVVLIGPATASSAEVFAMVLRQAGRALIVGTRSHGKCSTQRSFDLSDGGLLVLSVARIFAADHRSCQDTGVAPDLEVFADDMLDTGLLMSRLSDPSDEAAVE